MKKFFKVVAILIGLFVALLVVAAIALKIFFPAEKVKGILLKELSSQLHREVKMGDVSVGVLRGLQISDLKVSEAHTFAQGTFVSVDKLSVRVKLLPLLAKRVEVDTLVLAHPKIAVTRAADGKTFNFSDLLNASSRQSVSRDPAVDVAIGPGLRIAGATDCSGFVPCAEAAEAPAASAIALQVSKLEIDHGDIHFVDHSPAKQSMDLHDFNLTVKNFSLNTQTHVLQVSNVTVAIGQSKIQASGRIADFASAAPQVNLNATIDALTPASFGALAALPPALAWSGVATGHAKASGTLQNLDMDGDVNLDAVQLRYGTVFQKPAKTPFSLTFSMVVAKQSTADVKSFNLKLNTLTASGHARVDGLAQKLPSLSLHLATNDFSVPDLLTLLPGSLPPGITVQGPAQVSADISGTPASSAVTAKLSGTKLAVTDGAVFKKPAGMTMEAVFKGESLQNGQQLNINSLALTLGKLLATMSGRYITVGKDAKLDFSLKTNEFPLADLAKVSPTAAGYQWSGPGHLELKISGLQSAPAIAGVLTLQNIGAKSADLQAQGVNGRVHFATPNALAPETRMTLNTDGQVSVQNIHHTFYDGNAIKLAWNLTNVMQTADQPRIAGTAQLNHGAGTIRNIDQLAKQYKTAGIMLLPFQVVEKAQSLGLLKQAGIPAMSNLQFNGIHGDYAFQPGTMNIHAFDLTGHDLSLSTTGTVGLVGADQAPVNLNNQAKLAAGTIGGTLGEAFKDDQGRPTFKFTVTGPRGDPKVKLDLSDAGKKVGNALLKNVRTDNVNDAVKDIGNNLKNLFGGR